MYSRFPGEIAGITCAQPLQKPVASPEEKLAHVRAGGRVEQAGEREGVRIAGE
jgi:hypothetical protein